MDTADRSLWGAWRRGRDEAAFETLVRPHLSFAVDLARRVGCSAAEADDVLQDALVRLAREEGDRPVEVGLRAWIGRVVSLRTKMLRREEARRRRRERASTVAADRPMVVSPAEPPGTSAAGREVERALADLDEGRREAVVLHHLHDMPYAEMARVLGVSEAACRLRVHRGIEDLRKRLGPRAPALVAALVPFPPPPHPDAVARAAVAQAASGAVPVSLVVGGLVMANKLLLASAAVVIVGAGAFVALRPADSEPAPSPAAAPESAASPNASLRPREVAAAPAGAPPPAADASATTPEAPAGLADRILASGGRLGLRMEKKDATNRDVEWIGTGPIPAGRVVVAAACGVNGVEAWLPDLAAIPELTVLDLSDNLGTVDLTKLPVLPRLEQIDLPHVDGDAQPLDALVRQPRLVQVGLDRATVDAAGLRAIGSLPSLKVLSFRSTNLTDAGLAAFSESTRIEALRLQDTQVTDDGLAQVARMASLTALDLSGTRISGRGFAHLARLPGLRRLVLEKSRVTDEGLKDVASLRALERLDLESTGIGDAGVAHLAGSPSLVEVNLKQTRITDAALDALARIRTLKKIEVGKSDVTKEGVARFKAARPDVRVRD